MKQRQVRGTRVVALFLMPVTLAGCMGTYRVAPEQYIPQYKPTEMLVYDNTGTFHVVDNPQMLGDTLVGVESGTSDTLQLPISEVEDAMVKHHSKGRTMALAGTLAVIGGVAAFGLSQAGSGAPCTRGSRGSKDAVEGTGTEGC